MLFVYFGFKLLKDAYGMGEGPSEELQEVENELINKKDSEDSSSHTNNHDLENCSHGGSSDLLKTKNIAVMTQALTLTFLAEW